MSGQARVIVVLGMHRSGTSLLAQVLGRLGVALGNNLLVDAATDNKYGYWEHRDIAMTQDFLLAALGRMWHEPRGVLPLPQGWLESEPTRAAIATLTAIVQRERQAAGAAGWGFKDPRTLRFLPMWEKIFAACKVAPVFILALRRPESVVASLVKRNKMSPEHARFLWMQHNLEPWRARQPIAATIDYDSWFDRPGRNMRQLLRATGSSLALPVALDMCDAILDRDERHHTGDAAWSLADRIYKVMTEPVPDGFRAYRLRQIVQQMDGAAGLLQAWQEMIERCHPGGAPPVEAWKKKEVLF